MLDFPLDPAITQYAARRRPVLTGKVVMEQDLTVLDDPNRLVALRSYEILDTPPEPAFDRLAKLAAHICGMPYAAITFVNGT